VATILVSGCASYKPAANTQTLYERISKAITTELSTGSDHIRMQVFPILDDKLAKTNVGVTPSASGMLSVFVRVENGAENPVKVDLANSFLLINGEKYPSLAAESAVERAQRGDAVPVAGMTVLFGLIGGIATGSVIATGNRTIEEHYQEKSFKPTLINTKSCGSGLVFFEFSKEKTGGRNFTCTIPVLNLATNEVTILEVSFNEGELRKLEE